jgi:hypothetical protein
MSSQSVRLSGDVVIPVLEPLREVNKRLVDLLKSLTLEEWSKPTVHPDRDVKDLTAHLLHGSLRRVAALRDGYRRATREIAGTADLVAFIQEDNRGFIKAMKRVSPQTDVASSVSSPSEVAWRVWTKSMAPGEAHQSMRASGDGAIVDAILSFVAIMA